MQHYTCNTVEVRAWCRKCAKATMHSVHEVKLGACLDCLRMLNEESAGRRLAERDAPADEQAEQMEMFGGLG